MPKAKEFRVTIENRPSALAGCCLALSKKGINILAFQSFVEQGESLARFVVDDADGALEVLRNLHANFEQDDVVTVRLAHIPGQLGHAAAALGEHHVNINYSYCGVEPGSEHPIAVFGVDQVTNAAAVLDELAAS